MTDCIEMVGSDTNLRLGQVISDGRQYWRVSSWRRALAKDADTQARLDRDGIVVWSLSPTPKTTPSTVSKGQLS